MNVTDFSDFLNSISKEPLSIIDKDISLKKYISIDLSRSNKSLEKIDIASSLAFEQFVNSYLNEHNKKVAYGGYLEERNLYNRSKHFNDSGTSHNRNIHLGVDLWCDIGTQVLSVLDGEIHSFKNNDEIANYGPTIILKHSVHDVEFYSLYGHLNIESLDGVKVGQKVRKGQHIAALGERAVNGDYAPHLHFQLIRNLQDYVGDYPGVSSKKDLDFYKYNCPDPNLLLKLN